MSVPSSAFLGEGMAHRVLVSLATSFSRSAISWEALSLSYRTRRRGSAARDEETLVESELVHPKCVTHCQPPVS